MITRTEIAEAFQQQRELTTHAIEGPVGLESYMTNLGFDYQDLIGWAQEYTMGNMLGSGREWDDATITFVASLLTRAMALGLVLGRETKP